MITAEDLHIFPAVRGSEIRSHVEDQLVLDGFEVSRFSSASGLWGRFQDKPARCAITNQRFEDSFVNLELVRQIRQQFLMSYVCMITLRAGNSLKEIKEGFAVGVNDHLLKPHNPLQLRSRILVDLSACDDSTTSSCFLLASRKEMSRLTPPAQSLPREPVQQPE